MTLRRTCTVNLAGAAGDGTETPAPVIYITLTDTTPSKSFTGTVFFAHPDAKSEILSVALSAMSLGKSVVAFVDPSTSKDGKPPYSQLHRLYLLP
jgi:hypothetical protein